ncbi:LacI family DNA-binding transcriptional regulator [Phycisphaerales bacterium AB-hyl4]|uniref:LacI family DNA-binding transcriptional regulator n=1 Tax=Natronomicrosphaera hydrolytica TaxID=3242702 RepID=A0ABV4U8A0_9BACT
MARLIDIANEVGVSRSAAARVLLGTGQGSIRVSEGTRDRILQAAQRLGYRPNPHARGLKGRATSVLGIVVPYFFSMLDPIEKLSAEAGYSVQITAHHGKLEDFKNALSNLLLHRPDGILLIAPLPEAFDAVKEIAPTTPMVIVGNHPIPQLDSFVTPLQEGTRLATEYLIQLGHRRIAYACTSAKTFDHPTTRMRYEGFREALQNHGIAFKPDMMLPLFQGNDEGKKTQHGDRTIANVVASWTPDNRPTALLANADDVAGGMMVALERSGYAVPEDISVMGMMNLNIGPYLRKPLTTVDWQLDEFRIAAMSRLLERVRKPDLDPIMSVSVPRIIERDSCAPPKCQ